MVRGQPAELAPRTRVLVPDGDCSRTCVESNVYLGVHRGYVGIMEATMETTILFRVYASKVARGDWGIWFGFLLGKVLALSYVERAERSQIRNVTSILRTVKAEDTAPGFSLHFFPQVGCC